MSWIFSISFKIQGQDKTPSKERVNTTNCDYSLAKAYLLPKRLIQNRVGSPKHLNTRFSQGQTYSISFFFLKKKSAHSCVILLRNRQINGNKNIISQAEVIKIYICIQKSNLNISKIVKIISWTMLCREYLNQTNRTRGVKMFESFG